MPNKTVAPLGRLVCQRDSYLTKLETECIHCEPLISPPSKKQAEPKKAQWKVILLDTGRWPSNELIHCVPKFAHFHSMDVKPADFGWINETIRVENVQRDLGPGSWSCVHICDAPVPLGPVRVSLEWDRRFDHMQQHSAQHLISAIGERDFGLKTVSWALGEKRCCIELATPTFPSEDLLHQWESTVNAYIREAIPVSVLFTDSESNSDSLARENPHQPLPDPAAGEPRWIDIQGIDRNLCCGTHVKLLSHLQMIQFLSAMETVRGGQHVRVYFLAGQRVQKELRTSLHREKEVALLCKCSVDEYPTHVEKMQAQLKRVMKLAQERTTQLIPFIADRLVTKIISHTPPILAYHDEYADMEYLNALSLYLSNNKNDKNDPWTCVLMAGPWNTGQSEPMIICGSDANIIQSLGSELSQQGNIKGGYNAKMRRWQGKSMKPWKEAWKCEYPVVNAANMNK